MEKVDDQPRLRVLHHLAHCNRVGQQVWVVERAAVLPSVLSRIHGAQDTSLAADEIGRPMTALRPRAASGSLREGNGKSGDTRIFVCRFRCWGD